MPVPLGAYTIEWTDWWTVLLGLGFVAVTLFTPKGIGGLFDRFTAPDRQGDWDPDWDPDWDSDGGAWRTNEGEP